MRVLDSGYDPTAKSTVVKGKDAHSLPKAPLHSHSPVSRRRMLKALTASGISVAASLALADTPVRAVAETGQSPSEAGPLFSFERVAEKVYAAIARPAAKENCNAAVIVCTDHILVVDTHSKPSAAQALIRQIRTEISERPVRYVVNTHFHWDHVQGNPSYPAAYGNNVEIVSSTATREWLTREGATRLRRSLDALPGQIANLRAQLSAEKTPERRERLTARIAELEAYLEEMEPPEKHIILPTVTFDQRLVLYHGECEIHLLFLGRGHTAGDIVVYLPRERVVATGDLIDSVLPYIGDGYPDSWPGTLTALGDLDFQRVIPGHGSVQKGKLVLDFYRAYLEEINETVARGVERGIALAELQRRLRPARLRSFKIAGQSARLASEASALGAIDAQGVIESGVAANVADVYDYYAKRRGR
ncbi:MAG: MBL fold metallo-hydrolase [Blastocatellia bacterium]|nr:MBL fold metallo-hydrolase [Blastocatellia bacterium]